MRHARLQKLQRLRRKMPFYSFLILWREILPRHPSRFYNPTRNLKFSRVLRSDHAQHGAVKSHDLRDS